MIEFSETILDKIVIHKVGNKSKEEEVHITDSLLNISEHVKGLLLNYFLSPFKSTEFYNLHHESDINLNEVYSFVSKIFDNPEETQHQSVNLANHLYENSTHPKIKEGEFYVVYFKNCIVEGEEIDAVGLFKSESHDTYLKVYLVQDEFEVDCDNGININKLDKGCIVFNTEKENGYLVKTVDNLSKGNEAAYWIDNFLHVRQRVDNYFHTESLVKMYKDFVIEEMPEKFDVSKADQADMLNKSKKFLKKQDNFEISEFSNEVMEQPEIIDTFNEYKANYEDEHDISIANEFEISGDAVKKYSGMMKSVIKLDKNFHIYVHGNRNFIKKGYDEETQMHFYQVFFKEEK